MSRYLTKDLITNPSVIALKLADLSTLNNKGKNILLLSLAKVKSLEVLQFYQQFHQTVKKEESVQEFKKEAPEEDEFLIVEDREEINSSRDNFLRDIDDLIEDCKGEYITDEEGNTPLHLTLKVRGHPLTKKLIDKGVFVNDANDKGDIPLHILISTDRDDLAVRLLKIDDKSINALDQNGNTPLLSSLLRDTFDDVDTINDDEVTLTPESSEELRKEDLTDKLIKFGAEIPHEDQNTLVNKVIKSGCHYNALKAIMKGFPINVVDEEGNLPLYYAVMVASPTIVNLLIERNADLNPPLDKDGYSPCHYVAMYQDFPMCRLIINKDNIDLKSCDGNTPLHYILQRFKDKINSLTKYNDKQIKYKHDITPDDLKCLKYISENAGSESLEAKNSKNETPLIIATKCITSIDTDEYFHNEILTCFESLCNYIRQKLENPRSPKLNLEINFDEYEEYYTQNNFEVPTDRNILDKYNENKEKMELSKLNLVNSEENDNHQMQIEQIEMPGNNSLFEH